MKPFYKNLALWLIIGIVVFLVFDMFQFREPSSQNLIYSDFIAKLEMNQVSEVTIKRNHINGVMKDGARFQTYAANDPHLVEELQKRSVRIIAIPPGENPWYMSLLISWGPILVLVLLWVFFMRQMQSGGNKAMSFGKSRAKMMTEDKKKITFSDVAGVDEAKEEVFEIVEFLKDPSKFQRLGGHIPKGVLVVGPPGTGKTLLAKAIAGEADVPFFHISGSDFVEMFVGVGASRVRDLFEQGKKNAPCIIFIDEIDAVGRHRGAGLGGGHDEREQTLNQLLVEMDGFESNEGVILIAATNRPDVLDPALLRPGRFDRQIIVGKPDLKGRTKILEVHTKKIPLDSSVNLETVARGTPGFSGADLANLVNEAALLAARRDKKVVEMSEFEDAKDKVLMGVERKSILITEDEKRVTAFHEAGHTLVAKLIPGTDPVHKVSIIPRGRALGVTQQLPTDDRYTYGRDFLLNNIAILMGGRVAEELVTRSITTGAGNDIERATDLARKMVCEWGMSDKLGPITFAQKNDEIFLGREMFQRRDYSESTAIDIDREVSGIIFDAYAKSKSLISSHMKALHNIAEALLEKETLDSPQIDALIQAANAPG
ncbi:MAG: ATP-dependent zinc metalloprotease FtsH [Leptospirales bacterium]|jgi:cell division protease FtsH